MGMFRVGMRVPVMKEIRSGEIGCLQMFPHPVGSHQGLKGWYQFCFVGDSAITSRSRCKVVRSESLAVYSYRIYITASVQVVYGWFVRHIYQGRANDHRDIV